MDDDCDDDDDVEDEARLGDVVIPPKHLTLSHPLYTTHTPPPPLAVLNHPPHPPMTKPTKSKQIFVWPSTSLCIDRTALTLYFTTDMQIQIRVLADAFAS